VNDIHAAERFYREVVGLDLTARYGDQASFLSAGGYHHHVAVNTWGTAGAPPATADSLGLRWFALVVPSADARAALAGRLEDAGVEYHAAAGGLTFHDPSGHQVVVRAT
jgi:catechol 2,3-dioxygenase